MTHENISVGLLASHSPEVAEMVRARLPDGWTLTPSDGPASNAPFQSALPTMRYMIVSATRLDGANIAKAPSLGAVHKLGVGYDDIDIATLCEMNIPLAVCSIGTIEAVAEHALALLLGGLKTLPQFDEAIRKRGEWPHWEGRNQVRQLAGSHVGLLGFGRIGRTVASIVLTMGASVSVFVRHIPAELDELLTSYRDNGRLHFCNSLEELFKPGAIVSVHIPHTPATDGIITEGLLAQLGPQGIFINTARGALVDEDGLRRVLVDGRLGFAGLDVLRTEPPTGSSKALLNSPNLVVTPHIAGGGSDVVARRVAFAVDNLVAFHRGEQLRERVAFSPQQRKPR